MSTGGRIQPLIRRADAALRSFLRQLRGEWTGVSTEDLLFMEEATAARYRTGAPLAYLLSATVSLLVLCFVLWAAWARLDEVTRGLGQIIPSQRVQIIQNLEGGILEDTYVHEGQIVEKGDILVRLSNTLAASQYRDAQLQALAHEAAIARLLAEGRGEEPRYPDALAEHSDLVRSQQEIFEARRQQLQTEMSVLQAQRDQRRQEVVEMRSRQAQLDKTLALLREQLAIARPLAEQGLYPRVDLLKLERDSVTLQGDLDALRLGIPRAQQAAEESQSRMDQRQAEFRTLALDEMNRRQGELTSLRETLSAGADRVTRTDVRSPVRGTIKQLLITTVGGVIQPGQPILEVVPLDDTLLVEARVRPADIAFLHPGQTAMVKITAYDFSIYGGLEGVVEQISADTLEDKEGGSFYKVTVRTRTNTLNYRGARLPIIPGMQAGVEILTGHKTVLDYLLKPILKAKQNALRER